MSGVSAGEKLPRTLLLDFTRIGDTSATGELKAKLFAGWPQDGIFQLFQGWRPRIHTSFRGEVAEHDLTQADARAALLQQIAVFDPQAIIYRPTPDAHWLHALAIQAIGRYAAPLITWIVDDWPTALKARDTRQYIRLDRDIRVLLRESAGALSIGDAMSTAFEARYGVAFTPFANGVEPKEWKFEKPTKADDIVRVRYAGWLADNMGLASVQAVAASIERLAKRGIPIAFEIGTRPHLIPRFKDRFAQFSHTSFQPMELPPLEYRRWLSGADVAVICYNFDDTAKRYIQYSVANKLPECFASGAAVLAIGPKDVATMTLLEQLDCSVNVFSESPKALDDAFAGLAESPDRRADLAKMAQEVAFTRFDLSRIRTRFESWIVESVAKGNANVGSHVTRRTESSLWELRSMLESKTAFARHARAPAPVEADSRPHEQLLARMSHLAGTRR